VAYTVNHRLADFNSPTNGARKHVLVSYDWRFVKMNLCSYLASRPARCIGFYHMSHLYLSFLHEFSFSFIRGTLRSKTRINLNFV